MIDHNVKQQLKQAYDAQSKNRNESDLQDWKMYERSSFLHRLLNLQKHNLLEIGAGPGKDSLFFKEAGLNVQATDLSSKMVQLCREKGINAETMSFDQLTFEDQTFDAMGAQLFATRA
ncbi:bifunctional 2-polyprenyl-6-hydroxyphenol methylase/3-demethylubiquinol 3-O-methyltransferase UbiG [Halobacillus sp. BBL2006]|uniref:class I SAM-dependent methyltransferase n=1 Tax=Halobacillus sp. BBL2006 TaxID=1543706 RepID=UPI000ABB586F|nr:class I SAM-dependent methyltransferase [Halobacillus sp. BBL2006]